MDKLKLTYKNKKLSEDDKRAIEDLKRKMIQDQEGLCYICSKPLSNSVMSRMPEMAHMISKADRNIKKYGYEVIHHPLNMKITCPGCNSKVLINTSKTGLVTLHVNKILKELNNN